MASIDEAFRDLVRGAYVDEEFAEQLEHAARTVATSGSSITAITSVRSVARDAFGAVHVMAAELADRFGLDVTVESTTMCSVRFARATEDEP